MNRRDLLRGTAAALGGAGTAAVGLRSWSDTTAAQAALSLSVAGDKVTLGTDESVRAVWLDCSVEWAYELPSGVSPQTVIVELAAGSGDQLEVVAAAESPNLFASADGSESFESDLLAAGVVSAAALDGDGLSVTVEARLRVENADGEVLARDSAADSATVTANRETLNPVDYGEVGGSGELRIEIE